MSVPVSRLKAPITSNLQLDVQDGMCHNSIQTTPQPRTFFFNVKRVVQGVGINSRFRNGVCQEY